MLKTFAIHDGSFSGKKVGTLTYDAGLKQFDITVDNSIPIADLPLSLEIRVCEGNRNVGRDEAMSWVRGRICPPGRHNIGEILHDNGLDRYDEFDLLMVTMARCDKDELYIKEI